MPRTAVDSHLSRAGGASESRLRLRKNHVASTEASSIQATVAFSNLSPKGGSNENYEPEPLNRSRVARVCMRSVPLPRFGSREAKAISDAAAADMSSSPAGASSRIATNSSGARDSAFRRQAVE